MSFLFLDEIGVEPLAFVGQPTETIIITLDSIHKVYSGSKLNIPTKYTCGRYINVQLESRFVFIKRTSRFMESSKSKDNCQ